MIVGSNVMPLLVTSYSYASCASTFLALKPASWWEPTGFESYFIFPHLSGDLVLNLASKDLPDASIHATSVPESTWQILGVTVLATASIWMRTAAGAGSTRAVGHRGVSRVTKVRCEAQPERSRIASSAVERMTILPMASGG